MAEIRGKSSRPPPPPPTTRVALFWDCSLFSYLLRESVSAGSSSSLVFPSSIPTVEIKVRTGRAYALKQSIESSCYLHGSLKLSMQHANYWYKIIYTLIETTFDTTFLITSICRLHFSDTFTVHKLKFCHFPFFFNTETPTGSLDAITDFFVWPTHTSYLLKAMSDLFILWPNMSA